MSLFARKKQSYKFLFKVEPIEAVGVPSEYSNPVVLVWVRNSKVQRTKTPLQAHKGRLKWSERGLSPMQQVATLVRSRNRSAVRFEAKQFSFKLQEKDEKSNQDVTFAKATVDLADYASLEPSTRDLHIPCQIKGAKSGKVDLHVRLSCLWLKNAESADDALTDVSELTGVGGSSDGGFSIERLEGKNDDERDLSGFEDILNKDFGDSTCDKNEEENRLMNGKIPTTVFKTSGIDSSHKKKENENFFTEAVITEDDREYRSVVNQALENIDEDLDEDEMEDPLESEDAHAQEEEEEEEEKKEEEEEEKKEEEEEEEFDEQNKEQELQDSANIPSPRISGESDIQTKNEEHDDQDANSVSEMEDSLRGERSPSGAEHDGYSDQNNAELKEVPIASGDSADSNGQIDESNGLGSSKERESGDERVDDSIIANGHTEEHQKGGNNAAEGETQQHSELVNGKPNGVRSEDEDSTEYRNPADLSISLSKLSKFDILERCIEQIGNIIEDPSQFESEADKMKMRDLASALRSRLETANPCLHLNSTDQDSKIDSSKVSRDSNGHDSTVDEKAPPPAQDRGCDPLPGPRTNRAENATDESDQLKSPYSASVNELIMAKLDIALLKEEVVKLKGSLAKAKSKNIILAEKLTKMESSIYSSIERRQTDQSC